MIQERRKVKQRSYLLLRQEDLPTAPDLLIFFHGSLQSPSVIRRFTAGTFDGMTPLVAYPAGVHQHFNDARATLPVKARELGVDDVGFTHQIVAQLREEFGAGRVFAAGFSNGGQMVLRLLFDAPGLLAGAAVFASTLGAGDNHAPSNPDSAYQPTPVMFMHGTSDPIAPYAGGIAGLDPQRTRGSVLGAVDNAQRFAALNGATGPTTAAPYPDAAVTRWQGPNPVELWSVEGMGHLIPSGNRLDSRLGKNTNSFVAADKVREFFSL